MPDIFSSLLNATVSTVEISGVRQVVIGGDVPFEITFPTGTTIDGVAATVSDAEVTGSKITGFVSGAGTVAATDTVLQAFNKLDGNVALKLATASFTDAAVTSKLITGFTSGAAAVLATDTILQAINKLDGNVGTKLGVAGFSDAAVTGKLITGFVSGAGVVAATDTILQAINKLDANSSNTAVISQLLTGYTQPSSFGTISATSSVLSAIQQAAANAVEAAVRKVPVRDMALAGAIVLADEARTKLLAHLASTGGGTGAHSTADVTSGVGIGPTVPTDLSTLLSRAGELLTAYDTHETDAELGADWVWHLAQETGDHSLTSAVTPTTLTEAITRLEDLKTKLNAHDADDTAHDVASLNQISATSYADTVLSGDQIVGPSVLLANWAITIPTALLASGRMITVKDFAGNATANDIVVSTQGSEKIDGNDTYTIDADDGSVTLVSDGSHWFTI